MDELIQGETEITKVVTSEVTVRLLFTEEMLESEETFTYAQFFEALQAKRKEELVEIPEDMQLMIERYAGHTAEVVLTQVKAQLPESGKSDDFILAAIAQIRA